MHWLRASLLAYFGANFDRLLAGRKHSLLCDLKGTIAEVGPGTGNNLQYLPSGVTWIGIEPNRFMHKYLRASMARNNINGKILECYAEKIPLPTKSVDTVISTLVLCSTFDPVQALAEIRRVLKPKGQFIFIEHVAAQRGSWLRKLQNSIRPVWRILCDGCCPDRELSKLIEAGFETSAYEKFILRGASFVTPQYIAGCATVGDDPERNI